MSVDRSKVWCIPAVHSDNVTKCQKIVWRRVALDVCVCDEEGVRASTDLVVICFRLFGFCKIQDTRYNKQDGKYNTWQCGES